MILKIEGGFEGKGDGKGRYGDRAVPYKIILCCKIYRPEIR